VKKDVSGAFSALLGEKLMGSMAAKTKQTCPEGYFVHIIRQGESLITIAEAYGISLSQLVAANPDINPYFYTTGQVLCIPNSGSNNPACPNGARYTVREGDTFFTIADRYNVSVDDLRQANPSVDPDRLQIGQQICIPNCSNGNGGNDDDDNGPGFTCPRGQTPYVVRTGDTLSSILGAANVSYAALSEANENVNLTNLTAGQGLCLPQTGTRGRCACNENYNTYVTATGDTLSSVAARYSVNQNTMLTLNPNLTPSDFSVAGQIICVPGN